MHAMGMRNIVLAVTLLVAGAGCEGERDVAYASIKNDFNNAEMSFQPPWTICRSSYLGVEFGAIPLDTTSLEKEVKPGLDYVLMVAAWKDPSCAAASALPIASKNEEEIVAGQHRSIAINLASHQGSCPPEGVAPIPQTAYDRILALWPEFGFLPYDQRTQNPECLQ